MTDVELRPATELDLPAIVALLADDPIGALREAPGRPELYRAAFARLAADPNQVIVVAVRDQLVVGTLQLSLIPGLSRQGSTRSIIEAVRVSSAERDQGLGSQLIGWAIDESRRRGSDLVQLTSDRSRTDAHRFYERLGFTASHVGFKLAL